jgi:hypothetical protein
MYFTLRDVDADHDSLSVELKDEIKIELEEVWPRAKTKVERMRNNNKQPTCIDGSQVW